MEFGLFLEFPRRNGMSAQEAFAESFKMVDEAERMGVESVWLAEYHFNPGRVLSSPVTIASAIAARTSRMRIGLAVYCLPLGHPIRIAEEVATLDHISQGRLEFGIGRGTFPNVHEGYGSPFEQSRDRFQEFLEVIMKAWTSESFSFQGKYYCCQDLCVTPKPYQTPHPPIHVGITSAETFPIIGRMGYSIIINPSRVFTFSELGACIQEYRRAWREAGHPGEGRVGLRVPVYVAESAERAYWEPRESTMFAVNRLGDRVAVSASHQGTTGNWRLQAERILGNTYDDWLKDKVVYGTPESVEERLRQLRDEHGLSQIIYEVNYGNLLPYDMQLASLRLLVERVIPRLK